MLKEGFFWGTMAIFLMKSFSPAFTLEPFLVKPYKASYGLSLLDAQEACGVTDAAGNMEVVFQSLENGWTLLQNGTLKICLPPEEDGAEDDGAEDDRAGDGTSQDARTAPPKRNAPTTAAPITAAPITQTIKWAYAVFEAKNGRLFRFIWRLWIDDLLQADVQGEVTYDPLTRQGKIVYQKPEAQVQAIHGELLFPTAYLEKILAHMKAGSPGIVSGLVFSGNSFGGPFRLNTFVGARHLLSLPQHPPQDATDAPANTPTSAPTDAPANTSTAADTLEIWPTFTAIHHPLSIQERPCSNTSQHLTENGIPVKIEMDMGGFTIQATLLSPTVLNPTDLGAPSPSPKGRAP